MNGEHTSGQTPLPEENVVASVANDYGGSQLAYPLSIVSGSMSEIYGLTKRELFAAMAMQGLRADGAPFLSAAEMARKAVADADALLKELAK